MRTLIEHDVHHIAQRLKQINPKYVLFRNAISGRVEVHTSPRPSGRSLEFIVPFAELDERTLEHARKTRIENFDALAAEYADANAELERSAKRRAEQSAAILGDMMKYAWSQVHEVTFKKNKRWF